MTIRLFVAAAECGALSAQAELLLPPGAARHAQVRRVQPGDTLLLFDGLGSDWQAETLAVGRSEVRVRVLQAQAAAAELPLAVTLALGMPANERMDSVIEKAAELGAVRLQPLHTERSVLRLSGERAEKKRAHWQAVAEAACEQCGRAVVPVVEPVRNLLDWLPSTPTSSLRLLLSLQPDTQPLPARLAARQQSSVVTLNGPEGGLTREEEAAALRCGFLPTGMGARVLRADTAPLAVMACLGWQL
jgi:16S rRNA (uracil1498-N3)-methyltransferase